MEDRLFEALGFTRDTAKELISLASGIVALSLTFASTILGNPTQRQVRLLVITWALYFGSILFGILTLLAIIGNTDCVGLREAKIDAGETRVESCKKRTLSPYETNVRSVFSLQLVLFMAGTGALMLVGAQAAAARRPPPAGGSKGNAPAE